MKFVRKALALDTNAFLALSLLGLVLMALFKA
jgi:hypothetical protein